MTHAGIQQDAVLFDIDEPAARADGRVWIEVEDAHGQSVKVKCPPVENVRQPGPERVGDVV